MEVMKAYLSSWRKAKERNTFIALCEKATLYALSLM
jgi:hypothetical protein